MSVRIAGFVATSALGLTLLTAPQTAMAQAEVADNGASEPQPQNDEIIVTANKRAEGINRVGLTIAALSGEELANKRIVSLEDVAAAVPGLAFASSTTNTPILTLRGVGFNESSLGVYPAVSVYIDQAPLSFPVMASHAAYDLERIEVLKGPQGTLFGQNSTGGAINYIVAKPTSSLDAGASLSYGRFNRIDANGFVSGPLTERLGARLAFTGARADSWQTSSTRDDKNGRVKYGAARLLLNWEATDTLRFSLNLNGWIDKTDPQAQQFVAFYPQNGDLPPGQLEAQLALPFSPNNARAADWTPGEFAPRANRRFYQVALRTDLDLNDAISLTAITSYNWYRQRQVTDGDGVDLSLYDLGKNDGFIRSFNQEVRLANSGDSAFRWIIGGNFEKSHTFEDQILYYGDGSTHRAANMFIDQSGVTNDQKITNYAFFANAEYKVGPDVTLKTGVRYTDSKIKETNCGYSPNGTVNALFDVLQQLFNPSQTFAPLGPDDCYTLDPVRLTAGPPFKDTLAEDNVSWRVGVDYQVTPDVLIYGNISRGYKAGSYPSLAAATWTANAPVTQESVTAYEGGFKAVLANSAVRLNAAAFYYDYKDKQIRGKFFDPLFSNLDLLVNIPKSRIYGAEADLTVRPFAGLTVSGSITYLNSKVREYQGPNALGFDMDFRGDELPFTPKWSGNVNVDYRVPLDSGTPFFGFTVNSRSGSDAVVGGSRIEYPTNPLTRVTPGVAHPFRIDGYTTVDARIGYETADGRWNVMVWGKNLFDKYYWTSVIPSLDTSARFAGMPVTYGVTVGWKL